MPIKQNPNKDPKYFTAVLQLRYPSEEAIKFLYDTIENDKENNFISKEEEQPNGIDYYLSSNKFTRKVAKHLVEKFGGTLGEYERIFSYNRERSQNIYRMNILIEFPIFKRNDIIKFKKRIYLVKNIAKNVSLTELASGKDTTIQYKLIKEFEILKKVETRVARVRPVLSVLDADHQMVNVINKEKIQKEYHVGEKVKVVFDGECYLVK